MSHLGTLSWVMAWRTVTQSFRNVQVANTSESQNSVPVLPHSLGHTPELRGCNAWPSPCLMLPLKKNSCHCSNDAMLQDCPCCVPREPQAQQPCQEQHTFPLPACLRPSPESSPGGLPSYTPIQTHKRRGQCREWTTPISREKLRHSLNMEKLPGDFLPLCSLLWFLLEEGATRPIIYLTPDCSKRGLSWLYKEK